MQGSSACVLCGAMSHIETRYILDRRDHALRVRMRGGANARGKAEPPSLAAKAFKALPADFERYKGDAPVRMLKLKLRK